MKKTKLLGYAIPLFIFSLTAILLYYGLDRDPRKIPSPLMNKAFPGFQLLSLERSASRVDNTLFLNKISLLNVWASWCSSCQEEQAVLMQIAKTKQVVLYGLNYKDQRAPAMAFLLKNGNPYQEVLFDALGRLGMDLGVYGTPEAYLIDEQGIIRYKHIGPITERVWEGVILPQVNRLKIKK